VEGFPIVVMGSEYYEPLREFIDFMAEKGTISKEDLDLLLFTDSPQEAMKHIRKYITGNYKVVKRRPIPWLFERN
jgi:predicted Rossmann-fold nucleotide-binding protein